MGDIDFRKIDEMLEGGYFPQRAYNDETLYRLELEHVFARAWMLVGHDTEIPDPGDYARRYIGEDPFIFARDEDGEIRVFYNSCRHRGATLCQADSGNTTHFRCPYHGWTFNNKGDLVGMPHKDDVYCEFNMDDCSLLEAPRVDSYQGLVFASLDEDSPSLEEYLGDMKWFIDLNFGLTEEGMEVVGEPWRYGKQYNWKAGVENSAADNYHAEPTHASIFQVGVGGQMGDRKTIEHRPIIECDGSMAGSFIVCDAEEDEFWGYPDEVTNHINPDLSDGQVEAARRANLFSGICFPNMGFFHTGSRRIRSEEQVPYLNLRIHQPRGPNRTEEWRWVLAPKEVSDEFKQKLYDTDMSAFSPTGMLEPDDMAVWERVTEPAGSTFARKNDVKMDIRMGLNEVSGNIEIDHDWPGPATVAKDQMHEYGIRNFHRMWFNAIQEGRTSDGPMTPPR